MADNPTIDNGALTDIVVSADDAGAAGQVQRTKLAYSADGVATHVPADADGLLVNLGANNDVVISDGGNTITVDGTVAVTGVATAANQTTVIGHLDGVEGVLGTIDADTGSIMTAVQLIDNTILVDDAAFTPGTTSVNMIGLQADEGSTDSVNEGDAGAPRMTLDRKQITTPQPHGLGGLTPFRSIDLDETEEEVSAAPCTVWGWYIANLATTTRFVKFYNLTAANTSVGSSTPTLTIPIPGNATDDIAANALGGMGIQFDTALSVAATTALADADTGAPGANDVVINIFYKA